MTIKSVTPIPQMLNAIKTNPGLSPFSSLDQTLMELCTARGISCILPLHPKSTISRCRDHFASALKQNPLASGLRFSICSPVRSSTSEEISTETVPFFESDRHEACQFEAEKKTESHGVLTEEKKQDSIFNAQLVEPDTPEKKEDFDNQLNEATQDASHSDLQLSKFLEDLGIKLDLEDKSILVIGGGGIVALWLTATITGAIDSIPLLPKLLQLVGFGYTIWFTSRYLIFKESREELAARVKQVKGDILD